MIRYSKKAGFTLIELMIVVAIIAIIASIAIPKLMSARLAANESSAIATLRSIASAQQMFQSSAAVDSDADGGGEYGYFGELAGTAALREYDLATDAAVIGASMLSPAHLSGAFGNVEDDGGGDGVVQRSGYFFKLFLPDVTVAGVTPGLPELNTGGAGATLPDPNNDEILWCCYAWPVDAGKSGNRCFFMNQDGDVLQFGNKDADYDSTTAIPPFDAVFSVAGDMGSSLGINGVATTDGFLWTVLQ